MAKKNYEDLSKQILELVGGKDNIAILAHCVTRLRFDVKDKSLVNVEGIEKLENIAGSQWTGNQFQVIIGREVDDVYNTMCKLSGIAPTKTIDENLDGADEKLSNKIFKRLSNIFTPLLLVLSAGGMCKCLVMFLQMFGAVTADSGVYTVLNAIGDVPFYFMPFFVGATCAEQWKIDKMFGIMIAGVLLYPTFMNNAGGSIQFLFMNIPCYSYSSTVLPVILCVIAFSYLYKIVDKIVPKNFSLLLTGFISFALFMPILLWVVAPFGDFCGELIATGLEWFFSTFGPLAGALFAGLLSFYIMTGMHHALNAIMIQNLTVLGYDYFLPAIVYNNMAVAGATLGIALRIKNKNLKSNAISSGTMALFGISEPSLYGYAFKYKKPLIGIVVGGAISGALYMILGVKCVAFGSVGITCIPQYMSSTANLIGQIVCMVLSFVTSFACSFIFGKNIEK